jgi:uncharacterized protein
MEMVKRPKAGEVEERTASVVADGKRVHGVVPYGAVADVGEFRERIEPGALANTDFNRLKVVIDHQDRGLPLARFPSTLQLSEKPDGLHWSFQPPESRSDVIEALERGDIAGSSWRMRVARDRWEGDLRSITEIAELVDLTLAGSSDPVYETATVEYRTKTADGRKEKDMSEDAQPASEPVKEQSQIEEHVEDRAEVRSLPAGSLRVEDRTEEIRMVSLSDAFAQRGFFENRTAQIPWEEFRSFTWGGGTVLTDLNPIKRDGVPLGYDTRWLYPVLPNTPVSDATTSVQYLRQSSRTLAGTAVIRAIDATSTKPETSSTAELQTLQLNQVASVQTGIPRIHSKQPLFVSIVEADLRLSVNDGLDEVVRRGVVTAGTAAAVTGDILQKVRRAKTVVQSNGYNPDVLAIDPAGAESLDLLRSSGSEQFYLWGPGQGAPGGPFGLQLRVWKAAGTAILDSTSFGRLYTSPVELRAFEADAGATNKQNVRMELNAGYAVERVSAGLRIL